MANVFVGFGCLGILSLPNENASQQQSKDNDTLSYLVFVKDATSMGNVRTFDFMRINDVFMLSLNDSGFNSYAYNQQGQSYQGSSGGGGAGGGGGSSGTSQNFNALNEIK